MNWKLRGLIIGMEELGAKFIKATETHVYFDVPTTFTLEMLQRAEEGFQGVSGLKIKYKYNEQVN